MGKPRSSQDVRAAFPARQQQMHGSWPPDGARAAQDWLAVVTSLCSSMAAAVSELRSLCACSRCFTSARVQQVSCGCAPSSQAVLDPLSCLGFLCLSSV